MDSIYKRRFEELERCLKRISSLYNWIIITWNWEDSFQSPKDYFLNFLRVSYELKENIKNNVKWFQGHDWLIEKFYNSNSIVGLSLDIHNLKKHWENRNPRTKYSIWEINTWLYILSPDWKVGTILTIEIDWQKQDVLKFCTEVFTSWKSFIENHNL